MLSLHDVPCYVLLLSFCLLQACGTADTSYSDCLAGDPEPIFMPTDAGVLRHNFSRNGEASTEMVVLATDSLTIEQRGCDVLTQTFEFVVSDSVVGWATFRPEAARRLDGFARVDERLFSFSQYAGAVRAVPGDYPEAQPADMAPGLTMRAYPLPGDLPKRWRLEFQQKLGSQLDDARQ